MIYNRIAIREIQAGPLPFQKLKQNF